jgi:hypothetical protein
MLGIWKFDMKTNLIILCKGDIVDADFIDALFANQFDGIPFGRRISCRSFYHRSVGFVKTNVIDEFVECSQNYLER